MSFKYPALRTTLPRAGFYARLDPGVPAVDQFTADGSQDGTLTAGATRIDSSGLAYSFDGVNDYLDIPFGLFPGAYPFSISLWFNVPNLTSSFYLFAIADIATDNALIAIAAAGGISGDPVIAQVGDEIGSSFAQSTSGYSANTWQHVVAVFTSTTSRTVYLNGGNSATNTTSRTPNLASLDNIAVGALRRASPLFAQCLVDDIVFYPIALNASQVANLASQRGAIYAQTADGGLINSQSLVRPAGDYRPQSLVVM